MERESFENRGNSTAFLNREYICVKVDREERPDIDSVYMSVCQAMNGQGGWPLTILMTPDCRPFFSGTYFPPRARYGRIGLDGLLAAAASSGKKRGETSGQRGGQIEAFSKEQERSLRYRPSRGRECIRHTASLPAASIKQNGGFGGAPKFPTPHNLMFLMEYGIREDRPEALSMAETTLTQMYRAESSTTLAADFHDIPRMRDGWSRTSRRCCMTTPCL